MGLVVDIHSRFSIRVGRMVTYSMRRLLLEDCRHLILLWGHIGEFYNVASGSGEIRLNSGDNGAYDSNEFSQTNVTI